MAWSWDEFYLLGNLPRNFSYRIPLHPIFLEQTTQGDTNTAYLLPNIFGVAAFLFGHRRLLKTDQVDYFD